MRERRAANVIERPERCGEVRRSVVRFITEKDAHHGRYHLPRRPRRRGHGGTQPLGAALMAEIVAVQPVASAGSNQSYVEWGAVFAGAVAALAISLVLLTFGAAIGLSAVSPYTSTETGVKAAAFGSAFWFLLVTVWSFAVGGYLAGRLRHRFGDAMPHEVRFRDAAHGLLVWSMAVLIAATLSAAGISAVGRGVAAFAGSAAGTEPVSVATDALLRSSKTGTQPLANETRAEVTRLLMRSGRHVEVSEADKSYLATVVAANAGIPQPEAAKRVDDTLNDMKASINTARKLGIIFGFWMGSILLIGGAVAWWSATVGGRHREAGTLWEGFAFPT